MFCSTVCASPETLVRPLVGVEVSVTVALNGCAKLCPRLSLTEIWTTVVSATKSAEQLIVPRPWASIRPAGTHDATPLGDVVTVSEALSWGTVSIKSVPTSGAENDVFSATTCPSPNFFCRPLGTGTGGTMTTENGGEGTLPSLSLVRMFTSVGSATTAPVHEIIAKPLESVGTEGLEQRLTGVVKSAKTKTPACGSSSSSSARATRE